MDDSAPVRIFVRRSRGGLSVLPYGPFSLYLIVIFSFSRLLRLSLASLSLADPSPPVRQLIFIYNQ